MALCNGLHGFWYKLMIWWLCAMVCMVSGISSWFEVLNFSWHLIWDRYTGRWAAMQCVRLDSSKGGAGQKSLNIQIFFLKKVWIFRHVEWMHMNSQMCVPSSFHLTYLGRWRLQTNVPHISLLISKCRIILNSDKQAQTFRSKLYMQILFSSVRPTRLLVQLF